MAEPGLGELVTTTLREMKKDIADTITKNNGIIFELRQRRRIIMEDGGRTISCPLRYGDSVAAYYSGEDPLTHSGAPRTSSAEFGWRQWGAGVKMTGLLSIQNDGANRIFNILVQRIEAAKADLANLLASGVHSDGTGSSGKEIGGLSHLNPAAGGATVGGIPMATNPWYNNVRIATGGVTPSTIYANMLRMFMRTKRQTDQPTLVVADDTYYETFDLSIRPDARFMNPRLAKAGFESIMFKNIPVIADGHVGGFAPAGMHFLNMNTVALNMFRKRNHVPLEGAATRPIDRDVEHVFIVGAGNMTGKDPARNGRLIN